MLKLYNLILSRSDVYIHRYIVRKEEEMKQNEEVFLAFSIDLSDSHVNIFCP